MGKRRVLVLCGGKSAEHEVSLVSAKTILSNLDRAKFIAEVIFIDPRGRWLEVQPRLLTGRIGADERKLVRASKAVGSSSPFSGRKRPDVVFPVLHGPLGEDGTVQGLLELAGVPYVGCGVLGSAVSMDKEYTKRLCLQAGIPLLPYRATHHKKEALTQAAELGAYPLFVKPANLGSSVGVSKVKSAEGLGRAIELALDYDQKILLEQGLDGAREIECALLGDPWRDDPKDPLSLKVSGCGEVIPNAEFYTYEAKYLDPMGARIDIPARIPPELEERVKDLAKSAFRALDGYGMARADFFLDNSSGKIYFNELNTIPGFTSASQYPLLWKHAGLSTCDLISRLIELAVARHERRSRLLISPRG
ncbi:MAG: D-alanine--D-alanine ligase [Elusimicrobia bacterium]|nr:D-alanine--D-alanine ligase [Elusimicrobiota bacterium]